jgi:hypothetical protein
VGQQDGTPALQLRLRVGHLRGRGRGRGRRGPGALCGRGGVARRAGQACSLLQLAAAPGTAPRSPAPSLPSSSGPSSPSSPSPPSPPSPPTPHHGVERLHVALQRFGRGAVLLGALLDHVAHLRGAGGAPAGEQAGVAAPSYQRLPSTASSFQAGPGHAPSPRRPPPPASAPHSHSPPPAPPPPSARRRTCRT